MPRLTLGFALCAAIAFAAACGGGDATPTATPAQPPGPIVIPADEPITIGLSAALSGDQVNLGVDLAAAVELAVGQYGSVVKGHPVLVSRRDDECTDPEKAVDVAQLFIADPKLAGVIGPMCTTGAQAANRLYEQAGVVHISPSATRVDLSEQGERYFFRTVWRDDAQAQVQSRYIIDELGGTQAIVIDDGEPYGNALADGFVEQYEAIGGQVLSRQRVDRGTTDFASLVRQVLDFGASVLVYEGLNPEGALLVKALRAGGYTGAFVAPDGVLSARDFIGTAGAAAENAIVTGGAAPPQEFIDVYQALYQRPPTTPFVLQAHDATTALLKAIETASEVRDDGGLWIDRERLATTLREQRFAGLTGSITFDEHGDRRGETPEELGVTIYRVINGVFLPVQ